MDSVREGNCIPINRVFLKLNSSIINPALLPDSNVIELSEDWLNADDSIIVTVFGISIVSNPLL